MLDDSDIFACGGLAYIRPGVFRHIPGEMTDGPDLKFPNVLFLQSVESFEDMSGLASDAGSEVSIPLAGKFPDPGLYSAEFRCQRGSFYLSESRPRGFGREHSLSPPWVSPAREFSPGPTLFAPPLS